MQTKTGENSTDMAVPGRRQRKEGATRAAWLAVVLVLSVCLMPVKGHADAIFCDSFECAVTKRYEVVAGPNVVGVVQTVPANIVNALCADGDGCSITMWLINFDGTGVGLSDLNRFWVKSTGDQKWTRSHPGGWEFGFNDNDLSHEWVHVFGDCVFGDFDSGEGGNVRTDSNDNWGLFNAEGGAWSDTTTTCKVVIDD